jgi:hypothetical protein
LLDVLLYVYTFTLFHIWSGELALSQTDKTKVVLAGTLTKGHKALTNAHSVSQGSVISTLEALFHQSGSVE